ncbi:nitrate reductase molybdenum cofactor assembly chaperone [Anaerobacillus sp. MEB173]|uniref:nitrate reductase molybdenum cofactor assembly chaperone n=1 Tax=Anaerobacillus sp. MEB173 TaxID=3383345 RepID=UPI003F92A052
MKSNDIPGILVTVARALDYPNDEFLIDLSTWREMMQGLISSPEVRAEIEQRIKPLFTMNTKELQEIYVQTFDYIDSTGLYMTAHELGDSPRRGDALIRLKEIIREAGYECSSNEIADYIPMLLELLAVEPKVGEKDFLHRRLSYAIYRILKNLAPDNPYHRIVELLMIYAFETPRAEEIAQLENEREEADLDPLPYPMLYQ